MLRQVAALPVRIKKGRLEVLLVTTRETRRWIAPRGWLIPGKTAAQSARIEAEEEAGATGRLRPDPIGTYLAEKRFEDGTVQPCEVEVFRLDVARLRRRWDEMHERSRAWYTVEAAVAIVGEPGLVAILEALRADMEG